MKKLCISAVVVTLMSIFAASQTASSSTSGAANATIQPGQASAGVGAAQNTQAPGASSSAGLAGNAQASKSPSGASGALSDGSTLHTQLSKPVDAKKAKPGDEVTAKVTEDVKSNNKVVIHKGSKVIGHVTEAQARSKEHSDSRLGIAFDKLVLSNGEEVAFRGVIQAIAPPVQMASTLSTDQGSDLGGGRMSSGGARPGGLGGVAGGAVSTVGATAGAATNTVGSVGAPVTGTVAGATGLAANGALTSASSGVIGLQGLALSSSAVSSTQTSLITSPSQNVKLDSGTQLLLRAAAAAQ